MHILGVLAYDDSVLGEVTELQMALERKGYTVHLEQLGQATHPAGFGYFEEDSLILWLGRCYNDPARCQEIAAKYVEAGTDLIVAIKPQAVIAALETTSNAQTPIVFMKVSDPLLEGLPIDSEGVRERLTGVCDSWQNLSSERLSLLTQVVPAPSTVHIFTDTSKPICADEFQHLSSAAGQLGIELILHSVHDEKGAVHEITFLQAHSDHAILRTSDASFETYSVLMGATAREKSIPYAGVNVDEMERCGAILTLARRGSANQAAVLVERILKGEQPKDLPYLEPDGRSLGVNLQAAADLGLVISPSVLEKAQVIIPEKARTSLGSRFLHVVFISSLLLGLLGAGAARNPELPWITASLIAAVLVAAFLWFYLQWRIIQPLRRLTKAVGKFAAGSMDVELGESRVEDEVGVLRRAFRQMRSNLMYSRSELEKANKSLEQQIQERIEAYQALQKAQQELEVASRRIVDSDDSSRFALTTYIHDEVLSLLDELTDKARHHQDPEIEKLALSVDRQIRRIRFGLSVPIIQDMDVELRRLLQETLPTFYPQARRVKLALDLEGLKICSYLDSACSVLLYRFVNGAVSNVYRHANARNVSVKITNTKGRLNVHISDDGIGFQPASIEEFIEQGHYFFHDIEVRAKQLGGSFRIAAQPGQGASLEVGIPVSSISKEKVRPGGKD